MLECLIGYTPIGCGYGIGNFIGGGGGGGAVAVIWSGINAAAGCIKDATWSNIQFYASILNLILLIADKIANTALCVINIGLCYYKASKEGGSNKRSVLVSSYQAS
jgi:hypothetical protein